MNGFEGWLLEKMSVRKWLVTTALSIALAGGAGVLAGHAWGGHTDRLEVTVKAPTDPMSKAIMTQAQDEADQSKAHADKYRQKIDKLVELNEAYSKATSEDEKKRIGKQIQQLED
jgi:hypothetical protein